MATSEVSVPLRTDTFVPTRSTALLWVALVAATAISSIPILHAIAVGTGQLSMSAPLPPMLSVISDVVHGLAYLVFAAVLWFRARDIDRHSGVVRWIRRPLMVVFALYGLLHAIMPLTDVLYQLEEAVGLGSILFLALWVLCIALGIALFATQRRTDATYLLLMVLPALGLTIVLGVLGSPWAHPVYPEVVAHFGLALLALPQPRPARRQWPH